MRITLSDAAVVTYAIPPERLKPLMTGRLALDTFQHAEGERALVSSAVCRIQAGKRDSVWWNLAAQIAVHYTYVRSNQHRGTYLLRVVAAPAAAANLLHCLVPAASGGVWSPGTSAARRRRSSGNSTAPWITYKVQGEGGRLEMELLPPPTPAGRDAGSPSAEVAAFMFRRSSVYFWLRGRWLWRTPFLTATPYPFPAVPGRLRIPFWQEMGLLSPAEAAVPLVSHFLPSIVFACGSARPVWSL